MVLRKSLYLYRGSSGPGKCVRIHWDSISSQSCTRRPPHSSPRRPLRIRWRAPVRDSRPASASPRSAGTRSSWGTHNASLESESEIRSRTAWLKRTASHCTDASFDSLGWLAQGNVLFTQRRVTHLTREAFERERAIKSFHCCSDVPHTSPDTGSPSGPMMPCTAPDTGREKQRGEGASD